MKNSILGKILSLRKELVNSSSLQDQGIATLLGDIDHAQLPSVLSVSDGKGNTVVIQDDPSDNWYLEFTCVIYNNQNYDNKFYRVLKSELDDLDVDNIYLDYSEELSLRQFLVQVANAKADNDVIASILSKYTTAPNIMSADCYSIIDASNLPKSEANQLKQIIAQSTDKDGKLSNFQFLNIIRTITEQAKTETDNGGIALDESKVFYFSNFLGTAVASLISAITTLVGILVTMISKVLGLIISAIGIILNKAFDVFSQLAPSTHMEVTNPTSATYYFEGALSAVTVPIDDRTPDGMLDRLLMKVGSADLIPVGSIDSYSWTDGNNIYLNEFFGIGVNPQRYLAYIQDEISLSDSGEYYTFNRFAQRVTPDSVLMTEDEISELLSQPTAYVEAHLYTQMVLSFMRLLPHNRSTVMRLQTILKNTPGILFSASNTTVSDTCKFFSVISASYVDLVENGWDYFINSNTFNFDWCTQLAMLYRKITNALINIAGNGVTEYYSVSSTGTATINTNPAITINLSMNGFMHYTLFASLYNDETGEPIFSNNVPEDVDSISQERMFKYNSTTQAQIIGAFALIGAVAATVLIGGLVVSKQIKKFSWKRQQQRKDELVQMRNKLTDPDYTPTKQDYNDFYKMQKSYNFKAKLFGWDSYDSGNAWFDSVASSSDSNYDYSGTNDINFNSIISLIR